MPHTIDILVSPETAANADLLKQSAAQALHLSVNEVSAVQILRRSIDARRGRPQLQLKVNVYLNDEPIQDLSAHFDYKNVRGKTPVIIVGAGPAGLFSALKLLEKGLRPIIIERGKSAKERKFDIVQLSKNQIVNNNSNWCFGEGGAGTYTDGKLYTRSNKRGSIAQILQQLVQHGANPDILVDAHAHIGTDKLPHVIMAIRKTIEDCGGEYFFDTKITDFIIENGAVHGVIDERGNRYEGAAVILATGHSAHDIYELFAQKKWTIEAKPFALGVRAEHPQQLINEIQYRGSGYSPLLPAASYSLVAQVGNRGVFSFCMCPGGHIVPAATKAGLLVINGMSNSLRNSPFANSGIVAQVNLNDIAAYAKYGALAGLRFQQEVERAMCAAGGGSQVAPAQRLADFVNGKNSTSLNKCSYIPGITSAPLHELLPPFIGGSLQQAFRFFDTKMKGYLTNEANILAVESRTSSPVRIPRDIVSLQHVQLRNLYPCGEGAGYAGGITSSAIDGARCAEKIAEQCQQ